MTLYNSGSDAAPGGSWFTDSKGYTELVTTRIQEALRFWWNYLTPLLLITAPFALAGEAVQLWQGDALQVSDEGQLQGITTISAIALAVLQPFAQGALISRLDAIHRDVQRSFSDCLVQGARVAPALLLLYVMIGIGVYGGLLLFILPGLWVYARLCLATFIVTLENASPIDALRASVERTAGSLQWQILLAFLALGVLLVGILLLTSSGASHLANQAPVVRLLLSVITSLGGALISVLAFRFYGLTRTGQQ